VKLDSPLRPLTAQQYALLVEQAKRDALRLRRQAIADFWSAVARAVRGGLQALRNRVNALPWTRKATPCPR
jgi:hypothetical protein